MRYQSCRLLAVILILATSIPAYAATVDQDAEDFMKGIWRRYKTAPALIVIVNTRSFDEKGVVNGLGRWVIFCSEKGDVRVSSPTSTWVFRNGQTYGDSKFFPGTYITTATGANSGAALKAMENMWPMTEFPTDLRMRMASSWQDAFKPALDRVGSDGTVTLEEGEWADSTAASLLRFRSADGAFEQTMWVDSKTTLLRGSLLEETSGHTSSVSEPELRARLGQEVRFGTAGREGFKDFKSLSAEFNQAYSMPSPEKPASDG